MSKQTGAANTFYVLNKNILIQTMVDETNGLEFTINCNKKFAESSDLASHEKVCPVRGRDKMKDTCPVSEKI